MTAGAPKLPIFSRFGSAAEVGVVLWWAPSLHSPQTGAASAAPVVPANGYDVRAALH